MTPLTRRATTMFRAASADQLGRGAAWYPDAHTIARNQADEHGVTIEVASGVIAALSPRMGWGQNIMLAERMLASHGTLDRGALSGNLEKARTIYAGIHPLAVLRGPKTRAFYSAILTAGESPDAVIDRHAWDMLVGQRGATPPTAKQYRTGAERMARAAEILSTPVAVVQATTWLVQRELHWRVGAFDGVNP